MNIQTDDYDSPWKEILEEYFQDFMDFFFPEIACEIDWDKGHTFLDKELQQVVRDAELGRRLADKLVQVWRKGGEETWVLVHVEVQGQKESLFAKRMFVYNYRIFDRYDRPVASLAVLADQKPGWKPRSFGYELWGCIDWIMSLPEDLDDLFWQEVRQYEEEKNMPYVTSVKG